MNQFRRFMALLLAVVLVTGLFPVRASAEEQEPLTFETTYINPIYADIVSDEDIPPVVTPKVQTYETVHYVTTMEDAGLILREQMKARMASPVVHIFANVSTSEEFSALCRDLYEVAITHTREPNEGDYILWHLSGYKASGKRYTAEGGYNIDITYSMVYHSNAEQEAAVDAAVEELLDQLNLSGRSDYEKVKAVYDYICANVTYDHSDTEDTLKHTAYAALINKTAVCQGYASLLYRLLLELGVDTRVIAGSTSGGDHGWNIVELDSLYYNADSTWDAGNTSYSWFLKSPANFPDHNRFAEYTTAAFTGAYPMASADYVPHPHSYSTAVTAPTCTEQGYTTYTCSCGDTYVGDYVDATGHSFGSWYQTKAPTEDEVGEERRDCANCDHCETRVVAKLEPSNPSGTCGENLTWVFEEETGTLTISGTGDMYDADQLAWTAFSNDILSVNIGSGATSIGASAFSDCTNLIDVELPQTVMNIAYGTFQNCNSLKAIDIPENIQEISDSVFMGCSNLTRVELPDHLNSIGYNAFENCVNLSSIALPDSIALIHQRAFYGCSNLSKVDLSDSLHHLGKDAFSECVSLQEISIPGNVITLRDSFVNCTSLEKVTIHEGVCYLNSNLFTGCSNLSTIIVEGAPKLDDFDMPFESITATAYYPSENKVWTSEYKASYGGNITWVSYQFNAPTSGVCGDHLAWDFNPSTGILTISGTGAMYDFIDSNLYAPWWSSWRTEIVEIVFNEGITYLGLYALADCDNLTAVKFYGDAPENVAEYFDGCNCTIYYPANNETWISIINTNQESDITWIAFGDEPATSGTCGDNLTWNFNETSGKLSVSGSGDMYSTDKLGWTAFAGDIRSVEIGNGATSVGAYAFADCTKLEDVQMPNSVLSIAYNAFENCSSLTAVDIPGNVTEIAYGAFMDCSSLTAVAIPDNVMEISYSAFKDCTSLASLELPQNVMTISYHAFDNCTSLSEVDFPASLASIGDEAFGSCTGLDEMHFTGNAPAIQSNAFSSVTADAYYPAANTTWTPNVLQNYGGSLTWIAEGGTVTPDNSCGENITWKFEASTGTLTISGTEPMARSNGSSVMDDYARPEDTPWFEYQDQIITVIIESTVDSIGKNAFAGCSNLTTVIIEEGVSEIDSTAFSDCESLENCYFEGTEDQWDDLGADIGESTLHTESAKPEAHTETKKTVAPTCTEKGYDLYTCSCGTTRKDNFTDPAGHKWNDGVVTKEPTETETGIRLHTCTVCQETEERTIPVKDHTHKYAKTVTAPTCVADGYTTYICTCGDSFVSDTVPAQGHSWNDGEITREPSAQAPGIRTFTCTVCKTTRTEEIPYEAPVVSNSVYRISGKDRVKTALSVAKALKDTLKVDKFDAVIIATGVNEKFADALAGSYLANRKKAPILLYTNSGLSQLNVNFIKENLKSSGTVYILGGDSAVPTTVEQTLAAYNVVRLSGKTRYETNLKILEEAGISGADEILVATGTNFADSLSASAVGLPLLLVNGKNTAPNAVQTEFLKSVAGKKITIIGGDGAVSEEMKAAIEKITGVTAERISGKTRHNTSVMIAQKYFPDADFALITYAKNFPDGLAGGPLAYAMGAPLLLTNAGQEGIAGEYIVAEDIENGYVLGGDSAVSDETARKVFGLAADAAIEKAYYTG